MDTLKESVIKAYNDKIESIDRKIENAKADREAANAEIKENESEKVRLGKECTEVLKQLDEKGKVDKPSFHLLPSDSINLSKEACEKANNWVQTHELVYHTAEFLKLSHRYMGCTPCANYELRAGWTALGRYVSLVCTECEKRKEYIRNYEYDIEEIG